MSHSQIKSTANLTDREDRRFVVQVVYDERWIDANWVFYTNTLRPWANNHQRVKGVYNLIAFRTAAIATEAGAAIKEKYNERIRIIERNIVTEETFVGEV